MGSETLESTPKKPVSVLSCTGSNGPFLAKERDQEGADISNTHRVGVELGVHDQAALLPADLTQILFACPFGVQDGGVDLWNVGAVLDLVVIRII